MSSGEQDPHLATTRLPSGEEFPEDAADEPPTNEPLGSQETVLDDGTDTLASGETVLAPAASNRGAVQALLDGTDETIVASDRDSVGPNTDELAARLVAQRRRAESRGMPEKIGRYRVLHRLGEGGMGTVFAARDDELDRKIAIKLVRAQLYGEDARATARLLREAKALAKISHPNVIHVYEVGTWEGQVFVAMEFVDGWTLSQFQYRNVSTWQDLLELYKAAGRGLAAAHRGGLVHRDFKPDNVLVTRRGDVRVIDFGLARTILEDGEEGVAPAPKDLEDPGLIQLTRTGAVMGTPAYMAPEQHEGKPTDARTDQFAFCVALYEALYAQRPFAGETLAQLTVNVLEGNVTDAPPFIRVPAWIRRVLLKGLSVDPDRRYPDMEAMLRALDHDPARTRRAVIAGGSFVVASVVALLSWNAVERSRAARLEAAQMRAAFDEERLLDAEARIQAARARTLAERQDDLVLAFARANIERDPGRALASLKHLHPDHEGWVPAARAIATEALARGVEELAVRAVDGPVTDLAYAPSGTRVAVLGTSGRVALIEREDGRVHELASVAGPVGAVAFSTSGSRLIVGDAEGQLHVFVPGQAEAALVLDAHEGPVTALATSAEGDRLAAGGQDGTITLWRLDDGSYERRLLDQSAALTALAFGVNEEELYTADAGGAVFRRELDTRKKVRLTSDVVITRLAAVEEGALGLDEAGELHRWSASGSDHRVLEDGVEDFATVGAAIVTVDHEGELHMKQEGRSERVVRSVPVPVVGLDVSPDGDRFVTVSDEGLVRIRRLGDEGGVRRFGEERNIDELALGHRGPLFAGADSSGAVMVEDLASGRSFHVDGGLRGRPDRLEIAPDDRRLLGLNDRTWRLWALDGEHDSVGLADAECDASALAWTSDASVLAIAQCEVAPRIELYDRDGRHLGRHWLKQPVKSLRFGPDQRRLLATSNGNLLHLDLIEDEVRALPLGSRGIRGTELVAFAFEAGEGVGVRVATRSDEELFVWFWDPARGQVHLLSEEPLPGQVWFDPTRQHLLVGLPDGLHRFWDLSRNQTELVDGLTGTPEELRVSTDRSTILVTTRLAQGDARVHQVELGSGAVRVFDDPLPYTEISGNGEVLARRAEAVVETWRDPTPSEPAAFLAWLETQTLRVVTADELLARD